MLSTGKAFQILTNRRVLRTFGIYLATMLVMLRLADRLSGMFGVPDLVQQVLAVVLLAGLPLAIRLAWRASPVVGLAEGEAGTETDSDGDTEAKGEGRSELFDKDGNLKVSPRMKARAVDFALGVVIAVVIGVVMVDQWIADRLEEATQGAAGTAAAVFAPPERSIAVLPFANLSGDDSNAYLGDGIAEALLNELARLPDLRVAARTSAFHYKDRNETVQTIGRELSVKTVLEGSVRKREDFIRVTAQLVDTSSGYQLWSGSFDRQVADILHVQEEIADAIVATLDVRLSQKEEERLDQTVTSSAIAYDSYLQGIALRGLRQGEAIRDAIEHFEDALDQDPQFHLARAELAYCHLQLIEFGGSNSADAIAIAEPLVAAVLEVRPDLPEALDVMGLVRRHQVAYSEANALSEEALRINPNFFRARVNYGLSLIFQNRLEDATTQYMYALTLDPMNANLNRNVGAHMMLAGRFDDGLLFFRKALEIDPENARTVRYLVYWMGRYGRLVEAVTRGREWLARNPAEYQVMLALRPAYLGVGLRDQFAAFLEELEALAVSPDSTNFSREVFWYTSGDTPQYRRFAEEQLASVDARVGDPIPFPARDRVHWYGRAMIMDGEFEDAVKYLQWAAEEVRAEDINYNLMFLWKYLAYAYLRTGREDEGTLLLERCLELVAEARENGWATPDLFVKLAQIQVLLGDVDSALQNLSIAVDKGWRDADYLRYDVLMGELRSHPSYAELQRRMDEDVAAQRLRLGEL